MVKLLSYLRFLLKNYGVVETYAFVEVGLFEVVLEVDAIVALIVSSLHRQAAVICVQF